MKLICLFGTRKNSTDLPELMVAWDEYCADANYEGFEEECERAKKSWGDELHQWRIMEIKVPEAQIVGAFEVPQAEGKVEA